MQIPNNTQLSIINNQTVLLIFVFCLVIGKLVIGYYLVIVSWFLVIRLLLLFDIVNTIFRIVARSGLFVKGF